VKKVHAAALIAIAFLIGTMFRGVAGAGVSDYVILWINGKPLQSWVSPGPVIINDRVYVPLRAVSDYLGATVEWDGETRTAYIAGYNDPLTIDIQGPDNFKKDMQECISLLREKDPEGYLMVGRYVKKIVWGDYPNPLMDPGEMKMMIPMDHYRTDKYWWTATLVHEAQHAEQCYSLKNQTEDEREIEAYTRGLQTLKKTGATRQLIEYENLLKSKAWQK
jgi:hypothetical protein